MSNKSYVTVSTYFDPILGKIHHDQDCVILDRSLRDRFEPETVVGYAYCNDTQSKIDNDYLALVEIDKSKTTNYTPETSIIKPEDAHRTGNIAWIRKKLARQLFNIEITTDMVFVEPEIITYLESIPVSSNEEEE